MRFVRFLLRFLLRFLIGFVGLVVIYLLVAVILGLIPVKHPITTGEEEVQIFARTNGVHVDLVLPVEHAEFAWSEFLPFEDFLGIDSADFISIGWGDRQFYLETKEWSDLTISTALQSVLLATPSAVHVTYLKTMPRASEMVKEVMISDEQYAELIAYIMGSFQQNDENHFVLIPDAGYGDDDNFYEANGKYSCLYTCNNWVGEGLKLIGVKTAVWSPFDKGILHHLR